MSTLLSREIRLQSRPEGTPREEDFALAEVQVPDPQEGQFLVRNIWMSVDPYMRGRMRDRKSYVAPFEVGQPLQGGCVGQVVESRHKSFAVGDYVSGMLGWREYWVSDGAQVSKVDPALAPIQSFLGTFGMPGLTAYAGLLKISGIQEGESVFVSGAAGAVGSVACQIAKARGCCVVGSAGSDEKVAWLLDEAGIDEAINYKEVQDLPAELGKAFPNGIDVFFDNVGGKHLEAALENMKVFGRVAICGMISQYNATSPPPGPSNLFLMIVKRLTVRGFLVLDHFDLLEEFLENMAEWASSGKLTWKETVVEGIEKAPSAFLGLFQGQNLGKMLVKIGPDPAI